MIGNSELYRWKQTTNRGHRCVRFFFLYDCQERLAAHKGMYSCMIPLLDVFQAKQKQDTGFVIVCKLGTTLFKRSPPCIPVFMNHLLMDTNSTYVQLLVSVLL